MTRKINSVTTRIQIDRAVEGCVDNNEGSFAERNDEADVLGKSAIDFVRTLAATPDWVKELRDDARLKGLDKLTMEEIDAEIAAARRERHERQRQPG